MTKSPRDSQRLLRNALLCNALFSALSGLALVFAHNRIGTLLGLTENDSLTGLGVGLILFATALAFSARRSELKVARGECCSRAGFCVGVGKLCHPFPCPIQHAGEMADRSDSRYSLGVWNSAMGGNISNPKLSTATRGLTLRSPANEC